MNRNGLIFASFWLVATVATPSLAQVEVALDFDLPVDCTIGQLCTVQNYVDQDPGPGQSDYTCGPLSYDGHTGTDIRVPTRVEMRQGVNVVAAADGIVKSTRDGMADIDVRVIDRGSIVGREAGNGVVIDHGNGWESQYSHLRNGSVIVEPGDRVEQGQTIGLIGNSGAAEFPHVEFVIRFQGRPIDPFTGLAPESGCGMATGSLWSSAARVALAYQAGGLLAAGFAAAEPIEEQALDGGYVRDSMSADAPALVFWAASWGLRQGDRESVRVIDPAGHVVAEATGVIERDVAQWFRFGGRRRPGAGWPRGLYRGEYQVRRQVNGEDTLLLSVSRELEMR